MPGIIDLLIGRNDRATALAAVTAILGHGGLPAKEQEHEGIYSPSSSPLTREPPFVKVRLHASDLESVIRQAFSDEVKAAWKTGSMVEGQARRLMLVETKIRTWDKWWEATNCSGLYKEGREWWDEQGGLVRLSETE